MWNEADEKMKEKLEHTDSQHRAETILSLQRKASYCPKFLASAAVHLWLAPFCSFYTSRPCEREGGIYPCALGSQSKGVTLTLLALGDPTS